MSSFVVKPDSIYATTEEFLRLQEAQANLAVAQAAFDARVAQIQTDCRHNTGVT